jgi:hypothetical protein
MTAPDINQAQHEANFASTNCKSTQLPKELIMTEAGAQSITSILDQLRIPDAYKQSGGGIKLPAKTTFGKLNQHRFSRVYPDEAYKFPVLLVEDKENRETYLAMPAMAPYLGKTAKPCKLRVSVDNAGGNKLVAEPFIDPTGRPNLWTSTYLEAIQRAETDWVRIESDMNLGQYRIILASENLGEPEWPNRTMGEMVEEAFAGKLIIDRDHPFIRQLEGRK